MKKDFDFYTMTKGVKDRFEFNSNEVIRSLGVPLGMSGRINEPGPTITSADSLRIMKPAETFIDVAQLQEAIGKIASELIVRGEIRIVKSIAMVCPEYIQYRLPRFKTKRSVKYFSPHKRYWTMWPYERVVMLGALVYVGPKTYELLQRKKLTIQQAFSRKYNKYLHGCTQK